MRVPVLPLLIGALAVAALASHLFLPFAHVVEQDETGAVVRDEELSLEGARGEYEAAEEAGDPVQEPPAGFTYQLVSLAILATGGVVFAVLASFGPLAGRLGMVQAGAGAVTGLGAALTLHAQGLWAGRGMAGWIQKTMGWDNPPLDFAPFIGEYSPLHLATYYTVLSPALVVAFVLAVVALLAVAWPSLVRQERSMREHARRHGRLAFYGALMLLVITIVPLVVTVGQGSVQPEGAQPPEDTFFWSTFDVMLMRDISRTAAEDAGEGGLTVWDSLDVLMQALLITAVVAVVAPFVALAGKQLESLQQEVFGRLIENASLATALLHPFAILAGILAAFVFHHPNDLFEARTTALPLVIALGGVLASVAAFRVGRFVVAEEGDLVADEFPEPVVYD